MTSHYRAVVIGGGIVGASVLYHLAKLGWRDVALIERAELTAGSTWHAAAGCHALNDDPNIAALQGYTIRLYKEIEAESGIDVGLKMTGGINLAGSRERWEWLQAEAALFQTMDMDARLVSPEEIAALCPIVDVTSVYGGLYDEQEGRLDPHGVTHAYAGAARKHGAKVILHNRVMGLSQSAGGAWRIETEKGSITAEHVVNAGGLWARRIGRMAGVDLPVTPMMHHYLVTEDIPEIAGLGRQIPAVTDLEGFTYLQQERQGLLLGVYERNPRHWMTEGAEWDFGQDLLPTEIDRIAPELEIGFRRFPVLQRVGIKRWVNGAFTFTPDGNPLVGPVPGLRNYWVACGCMAGFSQGGAIGLALSHWMIEGDPGADIFGMDVARYAAFASADAYLKSTTAQFYARRFVMTYPNEELPAGRPLKMTPCYDALAAEGARFGSVWGLECPLYFAPGQPDFVETPTLRRSNAHDLVGREVAANRAAAGMFETGVYARYEISGAGAEAFLDRLLACRLPSIGRIRLAPMLSEAGKLMGDLTVSRLGPDCFWLVGSYHLQVWHLRWLNAHAPSTGVSIRNLSDDWLGFVVSGPRARDVLARLTPEDVSNAGFKFLNCRALQVGLQRAVVARLAVTGDLGYEITVPQSGHRALYGALQEAGRDLGLANIGVRALDCLRLEKGWGAWGAEYAQSYTPGMAGLDKHIAFDKPNFIGRDAALREREAGSPQQLVLLVVDSADADATGFEPVWSGSKRVGFVTSGAYGHHVGMSLAHAYLDHETVDGSEALEVSIIGERRPARILSEPPFDPKGHRLRS
ncbi:MAG: FAD-dependent oxidoreductase [Hyphomicrobiaceae bacterium]